MLKNVYQKYSGGAMMVMSRDGDSVTFLGTAFLVHQDGFLLTVAHILPKEGRLMVVASDSGDFQPVTQETVTPLPVHIVRVDAERDLALLKLEKDIDIRLPDHFIGTDESVLPGSSVMVLGFSFGHYHLHSLLALNAVISAKVLSRNKSRLLLFDSMVHPGARGGPLISIDEGLVVGVINGRFDPVEAGKDYTDGSRTQLANTNISFAVSIDYGRDLLEAEGLTPR